MITYPVDIENTRWAAWNIAANEVAHRNRRWPNKTGLALEGDTGEVIPLLEIREAKPTFDPTTHKLELAAPVVDLPNNTITQGWSVVPLTQEELDDLAERAAEAAERELAKTFYLDMKNHVGTAGERLNRVENVAAFLLKREVGDA